MNMTVPIPPIPAQQQNRTSDYMQEYKSQVPGPEGPGL